MRTATKISSLHAGQVLRAEGILTPEQLEEVQADATASGERVADVILARGLATEYDLAKALVHQLSLPYLSAKQYGSPKDVKTILPAATLYQHKVLPLDVFGDVLLIATYSDLDPQAVADIEAETGKRLAFVITQKAELEALLNERYPPEDLGKQVASRLDQLFGS
ncbi:MAG: hypothetical protein JNL90_11870 [Planctomycetes bacterium]|nr:hypothetical protein [Planctomycetota bacterium]